MVYSVNSSFLSLSFSSRISGNQFLNFFSFVKLNCLVIHIFSMYGPMLFPNVCSEFFSMEIKCCFAMMIQVAMLIIMIVWLCSSSSTNSGSIKSMITCCCWYFFRRNWRIKLEQVISEKTTRPMLCNIHRNYYSEINILL